MKSFTLIPLLIAICSATILDSSRITSWNAGLPSGISNIFLTEVTVADYGAVNDSTADASVAIQSALDDLKSTGGLVTIPSGVYRLDNQLKFNGDNIVLRGEGAEKTKLYSGFAGSSVFVVKYDRGEWQDLVSGFDKGSSIVTVTDGSLFTVGEFAEIQQNNDSLLMYTDPKWIQSWAENAAGQLFEVKAIAGNEVTFKSPLHFSVRADLTPQIRPQGLRQNCGIEDLYIEKTIDNSHTFEFKNVAYCWIRGVESSTTRRSHVNVSTAIGCEFRFNLFHHSWFYGGGGSAYGIEMNTHSSDNLVEDNIFYHLRHAMMVHVGAVGNVYGYNYSFDRVQGENGDEGELNVGWIPPDISLHGHYGQYNLFEGNIVEEIGIGDYWGPMGPGNTFLRNMVSKEGLFLYDHSHDQNIVGNWLSFYSTDSSSNEVIVHRNTIEGSLENDPSISETVVPESYYCSEQPNFWTDLQWPMTPSVAGDTIINPAAVRWNRGTPFENPETETRIESSSLVVQNGLDVQVRGSVLHIIKGDIGGQVVLFDMHGRVLLEQMITEQSTQLTLPLAQGVILGTFITEVFSLPFKIIAN